MVKNLLIEFKKYQINKKNGEINKNENLNKKIILFM